MNGPLASSMLINKIKIVASLCPFSIYINFIRNANVQNILKNCQQTRPVAGRWMDGWTQTIARKQLCNKKSLVDGWEDRREGTKAGLRIAYCNQKLISNVAYAKWKICYLELQFSVFGWHLACGSWRPSQSPALFWSRMIYHHHQCNLNSNETHVQALFINDVT